jgi:hypothetical protein
MKPILTFRASHIDLYRKYLNNEINVDSLMYSLQYNTESTLKMQLGTMFHSLLENKNKEIKYFNIDCINYARQMFYEGVFEIKNSKIFNTKFGDVLISGTVDNLLGNQINEFKTTWGQFNVEKYLNSLQWQLYLQIFSVPVMAYHVFEFPNVKTSWNNVDDIESELYYNELHQFKVYESMINFTLVNECINGLTEFCINKQISPKLTNSN